MPPKSSGFIDGGGLFLGNNLGGAPPANVTLIAHSTIANNQARGIGDGIMRVGSSLVELQLDHTIVADNADMSDLDGQAVLSYSILENTAGATVFDIVGNQLGVDPRLGPLGDHGGFTADP